MIETLRSNFAHLFEEEFWIYTLVSIALGYLYWFNIGCSSGSCAITSVWWRSTLYGMLFGFLLRDVVGSWIFKLTGW